MRAGDDRYKVSMTCILIPPFQLDARGYKVNPLFISAFSLGRLSMSRQGKLTPPPGSRDDQADRALDKATTDRNARILRDLVKQPDNKACADCRKNGWWSLSLSDIRGVVLITQMLDGLLGICELA